MVDFDVVEDSNLQRQVLFTTQDVGRPKVEAAAERLRQQNPHVTLRTYDTQLTAANALEILRDYDVVADGTDNFPTRYLVNDACVLLDKVNVYASVFRFEGQVSVFNYRYATGHRGPNYRDLFPEPPSPHMVPNCAEGGVLGVLPGIVGSLQANEVIKVITGLGAPLAGRLFVFDALSFTSRTLKFAYHADNPLRGEPPAQTTLIDYEAFCSRGAQTAGNAKPQEISVQELQAMIDRGADFQLIDVREPYEYDIANLGGQLIPLQDLSQAADQIATDKPVVVHCRSGKRSAQAIAQLSQSGFSNLYNLKGGILAWAQEIDASMPRY